MKEKEWDLLTAYSARGQLMYYEVFIYVEDILVLLGI
jgi:hypothetical protein